MVEADSVLPWDGPDSCVRLRVPSPDRPPALRVATVHPNFNRINPSLPPTCPNSISDPTPNRAIAQSRTGLPASPTNPSSMIYQTNPFSLPNQTKQITCLQVERTRRANPLAAWARHARALSPRDGWGKLPTSPVYRPQSSRKYANSTVAPKMQRGLTG